MIRLLVSNQRGGVAKTTTTVSVARYFADLNFRVLVIDTDPQGSIAGVLGLQPAGNLHSFLIKKHNFRDCLVSAHTGIDVLCSDRQTVQTEGILMAETARELTFNNVFPAVDKNYDVVLIDVAPSISLLQTCGMLYAKQLLIPVAMDPLSLQGAAASIETARTLSDLFKISVKAVALLPVMVDRRLQITETILDTLKELAVRSEVAVLPAIRTDATVTKANRQRQFVIDYDPKCKAVEDYNAACDALKTLLQDQLDARPLEVSA
jgi:chromosome partitioning protein